MATILGLHSDPRPFAIVREVRNGSVGAVVDFESTVTDATFLARLYAQEHADRLDVPMTETASGGKFVTNNGSLVIYTVAVN